MILTFFLSFKINIKDFLLINIMIFLKLFIKYKTVFLNY